ncbi:MAG: glycosyltransferase family protein, partial [Proteobacteria bacterium]|nr:glycosyltransferase family protein [Pseudomonadota bacterium]
LATAQVEQKSFDDALASFRQAAALAPDNAAVHSDFGAALFERSQIDEAEFHCRRAIELSPGLASAHSNLGNVLQVKGALDDAIASYRQAVALDPMHAEAHNGIGFVLLTQGQTDQALAVLSNALAIKPGYASALFTQALAFIAAGQLANGWALYEHGWEIKSGRGKRRPFAQPLWDGGDLGDRTLLLWGEQGIGDEVLYAGCLSETFTRAPRCVVECEPRLVPLFARSFPQIEVIARSDPPHPRAGGADIAAQLAMGSQPRFFRPNFESFPKHQGYLRPDAARTAALKARHRAAGPGPIIGISWRTGRKDIGRWRSLSLLDWEPILTMPNVVFVNLQYGDCAADLAAVRDKLGVTVHHDADVDPLKDLDSFAAQVAGMDLVVSIDNSTIHFAGALNVPVWTLLPVGFGLTWYWFRKREDTPWYPSMRLFRQREASDWSDVIGRIVADLKSFCST